MHLPDLPASLVRRVDHVGIAVRSIEAALPLYAGLFGGQFVSGGDDPVLGIRTVQLRLRPDLRVELLQPATPDCYLHGHLDRHGEGFHHMTLLVDDLEEAMARVEAAGFELTGTDTSDPAWRATYIRPRSGFGMLFQLVETPHDWDQPAAGVTLEGVLAGEFVWQGDRAVRRGEAAP